MWIQNWNGPGVVNSHVPEVSHTDAELKDHDVVADMEAVKNVVVPSLSYKAGHLDQPVSVFQSFGCSSKGLYSTGYFLADFGLNDTSFPNSTSHGW